MDKSIETLIERTALRDRAAFRMLYDRTSAKLFGVCLRILKDRAEAEDVLQEVYAKIWRNASQYAPSGHSPVSWLAVVARNHAIDRLRARKPDPVEIDVAETLADSGPGPEQAAVLASENRALEECLKTLTEDRAAAVRGAYLEGWSYKELAEHYAAPLNTIRTWLRRGLMQLKECLEG